MQSIALTVALVVAIGLVGSVILAFSSKALAVEEDERLDKIVDILPGLNCGSCGHPGCEGYAQAILEGAPCTDCVPGGSRVAGELAEQAALGREAHGQRGLGGLGFSTAARPQESRKQEYKNVYADVACHNRMKYHAKIQ